MNWRYKGGRISKPQVKWERWKQMKHDKAIAPSIELKMRGTWQKKIKKTLCIKNNLLQNSSVIPRRTCDLNMFRSLFYLRPLEMYRLISIYILFYFTVDRKERRQTQSSLFSLTCKGKTSQLSSPHIVYHHLNISHTDEQNANPCLGNPHLHFKSSQRWCYLHWFKIH